MKTKRITQAIAVFLTLVMTIGLFYPVMGVQAQSAAAIPQTMVLQDQTTTLP